MPVSINKEKISVDRNVIRGAGTVWIEQDILVPDTKPDVMKILKVDNNVYISSKEVMDSSIRVTGQISYYIIYLSVEGRIRGINMSYPFVKVIDNKEIKKDMRIRIIPTVKNIIYSLPNERKISVKTEVLFRYKLAEIGEVDVLRKIDECDSLECKMSKDSFFNIIEQKTDVFEAREDIMIPEGLPGATEILRVSNSIVNTEYKVSYNKILVKGEIKTDIVYVSNLDNNEIYSYETNIPFTGMIEFTNISDSAKFDIQYSLKSFEVNLEMSNETGRMISVSADIEVDAMLYEEKEIEYIDDFYSMEEELNYLVNTIDIVKNKEMIVKTIMLKDNVGTVPESSRILDYSVDISNLATKISGGNIYINGAVKINVMYEVSDGKKIESKTYDMLVDETVDISKDLDEKYISVNMEVTKAIVRINGNNVDANVELIVNVDVDNVEKIKEISDIKEEKINLDMFDSMNLYIVKKGDNLWDIAKKYKTSVAKIANINDLPDENKLDVGQKILIIR